MSACTFFGHRECHGLDREILYKAIAERIRQGVDTMYPEIEGHPQFAIDKKKNSHATGTEAFMVPDYLQRIVES